MPKLIDLIGQKYGRLTIIKAGTLYGRIAWECQCSCGATKMVTSNDLRRRKVQSCGCIRRETAAAKSKYAGNLRGKQLIKHGLHGTRLYGIWKSMRNRCNNPKSKDYVDYGKRGIKVCKEWNDFAVFHAWALNNKYNPNALFGECTIDRVNVNGDYCPENCQWVDMKTQANNRRSNKKEAV